MFPVSFHDSFSPRLVTELAWLRNRVKDPFLFAGANIETTYVARRRIQALSKVLHYGPHDNRVAANDRWRVIAECTLVEFASQPLAQVDPAPPTKVWVGLARFRIDGD